MLDLVRRASRAFYVTRLGRRGGHRVSYSAGGWGSFTQTGLLILPFVSLFQTSLSQDYISVKAKHTVYVPHRGSLCSERFHGAVPYRRRLVNALMMHGRNNGKKLMAVRIVKHTMDIIHLLSDQNPLQVIVDAIINSGPRGDATRVGSANVIRRQAVGMSPLRRVNQAIWLITTGAPSAFLA